jgi:peptide/nickel transport system substrate-binding protein
MRAVNQADFMAAAGGSDPALTRTGVGVFCPVSPMANDAGMEALNGPARPRPGVARDARGRLPRASAWCSWAPPTCRTSTRISEVGADLLRRLGMNVDYQAMDWGTAVQRRVKREPPEGGGWNVAATYWSGIDTFNPAVQISLRGNGAAAGGAGRRSSAWSDARRVVGGAGPADAAAHRARYAGALLRSGAVLAARPAIAPTAYRTDLSGVPRGFALFWNVRRGA